VGGWCVGRARCERMGRRRRAARRPSPSSSRPPPRGVDRATRQPPLGAGPAASLDGPARSRRPSREGGGVFGRVAGRQAGDGLADPPQKADAPVRLPAPRAGRPLPGPAGARRGWAGAQAGGRGGSGAPSSRALRDAAAHSDRRAARASPARGTTATERRAAARSSRLAPRAAEGVGAVGRAAAENAARAPATAPRPWKVAVVPPDCDAARWRRLPAATRRGERRRAQPVDSSPQRSLALVIPSFIHFWHRARCHPGLQVSAAGRSRGRGVESFVVPLSTPLS